MENLMFFTEKDKEYLAPGSLLYHRPLGQHSLRKISTVLVIEDLNYSLDFVSENRILAMIFLVTFPGPELSGSILKSLNSKILGRLASVRSLVFGLTEFLDIFPMACSPRKKKLRLCLLIRIRKGMFPFVQ